ncbi:outer membrane beta-barrel protein [Colwelliaceae bacterium 6441]
MSQRIWIKISHFLLLTLFFNIVAIAQDEFITESGNHFDLSLATELGSVDNFLFDNKDEQSTTFVSFSPSLKIQTQFQRQLLRIEAKSEHRKYQDFSRDDHTNFSIAPRYQFKLAENKAIFVNGSFNNLYENRGTGLSLGNGSFLNKGDNIARTDISGGYLFGRKDSVAKFRIEIGHFESRYQTRRDTTFLLDKQNQYADLSFDYLLSGQSYLSSNFVMEKLSSENNGLLDKEKYIALVGIKWQTTEISQFALLLGYQEIKFDQSTFADDNAFKWRFGFNWHPIYSTKLSFRTERDFEEANRLSNSYRVVDNYDMKIMSNFTDFFQAVAVIGIKQEKIIYQQGTEEEDYIFANLRLNYKRNDWLTLYVEYDVNDLDASDSVFNYQRNSISVGFNVTI